MILHVSLYPLITRKSTKLVLKLKFRKIDDPATWFPIVPAFRSTFFHFPISFRSRFRNYWCKCAPPQMCIVTFSRPRTHTTHTLPRCCFKLFFFPFSLFLLFFSSERGIRYRLSRWITWANSRSFWNFVEENYVAKTRKFREIIDFLSLSADKNGLFLKLRKVWNQKEKHVSREFFQKKIFLKKFAAKKLNLKFEKCLWFLRLRYFLDDFVEIKASETILQQNFQLKTISVFLISYRPTISQFLNFQRCFFSIFSANSQKKNQKTYHGQEALRISHKNRKS